MKPQTFKGQQNTSIKLQLGQPGKTVATIKAQEKKKIRQTKYGSEGLPISHDFSAWGGN